jgi:HK97 family phage prohead protease
MSEIERRIQLGDIELRGEGEERKIVGYAAKFNSRSVDLGGFVEILDPGAFNRAIEEAQDVRALVDHNPTLILGRTKSGTLSLSIDETGLLSTINPPETQAGRDIKESVGRGDVTGMSFSFRVMPDGDYWRKEDDRLVRHVRDVELYDVSVVTYPAYPATEVSLRAIERAKLAAEPPPPPLERLAREMEWWNRA